MAFDYHEILIFISVVLFIGVLLKHTAQRVGVQGLLIYLTLSIFIGNGGSFDFVYDFPECTLSFSQLALSLIIFIGGSDLIFHCVFTIVLFSVLFQMTTLEWVARNLNVTERAAP
jgi:NhaP-type Na+/H+ and K+/H+ antiporter